MYKPKTRTRIFFLNEYLRYIAKISKLTLSRSSYSAHYYESHYQVALSSPEVVEATTRAISGVIAPDRPASLSLVQTAASGEERGEPARTCESQIVLIDLQIYPQCLILPLLIAATRLRYLWLSRRTSAKPYLLYRSSRLCQQDGGARGVLGNAGVYDATTG
ncbi:hypothetical protein BaRGS_00001759 [Batillaria attramentaria]|uniref:Uncharacterized protein n=1 Tax=Batillaria attramentaria TaxID=370345 RepID=A0ABD0M601_9CAEN